MPLRRSDDLSRSLRHEGRPLPLNRGDPPRPTRLCARATSFVEAAIWESSHEDLRDFGALDPDAFLRRFGERPGRTLKLIDWTAALRAQRRRRPEALALAAAIGRQAPVAVLTNNNLLVALKLDAIFADLRRIFGHRIFVSAEIGARKPDPEVYRRCLHRIGAAPDATLFVDDSANNLVAPSAWGSSGMSTPMPSRLPKR